jgi:hypothetical protein
MMTRAYVRYVVFRMNRAGIYSVGYNDDAAAIQYSDVVLPKKMSKNEFNDRVQVREL